MLYRPVSVRGRLTRAHISTHLAADPDLSRDDRMEAVDALGQPHSYLHPGGPALSSPDVGFDTIVTFFDAANESRRYQQASESRFAGAGVARAKLRFPQAILHPPRLDQCLAQVDSAAPLVARAAPEDTEAIANLFAEHGRQHDVAVMPSPAWVGHHFFGFEDSRVFVSRRQDSLDGCIACYALDTVSAARRRRVAVIEYLLVHDVASAAALLREALRFADEHGARGVVMENPTYLDQDLRTQVGLMPSTRGMVAAVGCRSVEVGTPPTLLLDLK